MSLSGTNSSSSSSDTVAGSSTSSGPLGRESINCFFLGRLGFFFPLPFFFQCFNHTYFAFDGYDDLTSIVESIFFVDVILFSTSVYHHHDSLHDMSHRYESTGFTTVFPIFICYAHAHRICHTQRIIITAVLITVVLVSICSRHHGNSQWHTIEFPRNYYRKSRPFLFPLRVS